MRLASVISVLAVVVLAGPALGQESIPVLESVTVQGSPSSTAGTYESLLRGMTAFTDKRDQFSPDSRLSFRVSKAVSEIYIDVDGELVSVQVDADRTFKLPVPGVKPGPWKILAFGGGTQIVPLVESSLTTDSRKRLGDLRLQCQVLWSMVEPDVPTMKKLALKMSGGLCNSSVVAIIFPTDAKLSVATLEQDGLSNPVKLAWDRLGFYAPIKDSGIANSAIITLTYE